VLFIILIVIGFLVYKNENLENSLSSKDTVLPTHIIPVEKCEHQKNKIVLDKNILHAEHSFSKTASGQEMNLLMNNNTFLRDELDDSRNDIKIFTNANEKCKILTDNLQASNNELDNKNQTKITVITVLTGLTVLFLVVFGILIFENMKKKKI
jgi:hypothetical protein